jgi:hypothetical protein
MLSETNYYVPNAGKSKHNYLYNYTFAVALHAPSSFAYVMFLLHLSDLSFPMLDVISYESQFFVALVSFEVRLLASCKSNLSSLEPDS